MRGAAEEGFHARMRDYFARAACARGHHVLELSRAIAGTALRFEFATDGQWNELANGLVAEGGGETRAVRPRVRGQ